MTAIKQDILSAYKGFIFDIDGTIIDSMKVHMKAWQKVLENHGCHMSVKEVEEIAYGINPEIVKRALGNLPDEEVERISNEKEELFRNSFDPEEDVIKGFIHFIDELKRNNIPMVIGSAAPSANIDFFMERLGVGHYFKGFIGEEDVKHGKPSPEVFKKAVQLLDLPPQDCIVFEDSTKGAEAASKAGIKTIAVLSTKSKADFKDHPDVVGFIKDYTELLEDQSEKR